MTDASALRLTLDATYQGGEGWIDYRPPTTDNLLFGEVLERLNRPVSKTGVPSGYRGFESHPLRQKSGNIKVKTGQYKVQIGQRFILGLNPG